MGYYRYDYRIKINNDIFVFVFFGFAQLRMNVNLKVPVASIEHYFSPPMDSWWSRKINDQMKKTH